MATAAIYTRVSTTMQEDGSSLDTQEEHCRARAGEDGLAVSEPHVFRETHTGTELWERPKLSALREAIRRHEIDVVIVYAIDRLARDPVHLGVVLSEADHAGVEVRFVTEPLDNSPEGQLIWYVRGYAAKVEHEKIKERTRRGIIARAQSGKPLCGPRPLYGYRWNADKSALMIDPVTGPIVRRIFTDAAEGKSLRAIAESLSEEMVPTATGLTSWAYTTVRSILCNPTYTGQAVALRYRTEKRKGMSERVSVRPEDEQVPLPGVAPPLIDRATYDAVAERLKLNRQLSVRNAKEPQAALLRGGFVRCGLCSRVMRVHRNRQRYTYRCDTSKRQLRADCGSFTINVSILDDAVWSHVEAVLTQPDVVGREVARLQQHDPSGDDLTAVERALKEVARQQANLARALAQVDDEEVGVPITAELQVLTVRRRTLEEEREKIVSRRNGWLAAQERLADLQTWCSTVASRLTRLDYEAKRSVLVALGVQVKLFPTSHNPRWIVTADIPLDEPAVYTTAIGSGLVHHRRKGRSAAHGSPPAAPP